LSDSLLTLQCCCSRTLRSRHNVSGCRLIAGLYSTIRVNPVLLTVEPLVAVTIILYVPVGVPGFGGGGGGGAGVLLPPPHEGTMTTTATKTSRRTTRIWCCRLLTSTMENNSPAPRGGFLQVAVSEAPLHTRTWTYRYKPVPVSALAIYHSPRKSLESQLQRSLTRQPVAHREQAPEAIRILPAPDVSAATVAAHAPAQVAVRTFIVK
jgi:hypothetical protein